MGCCFSGGEEIDPRQQRDEQQKLLGSKSERIENNFCFKCGSKLYAGSQFCPKCGAPIPGAGREANNGEDEGLTAERLKQGWKQREEEDRRARLKKEAEEEERKQRVNQAQGTQEQRKELWKEREIRLQKERAEAEKLREERGQEWMENQERRKKEEMEERKKKRREERIKSGAPGKSQSLIIGREAKRGMSILGETEETFRKRQNLERQESQQQLYGMDLELHLKAIEKLQGEEDRIKQAMEWIEAVTGVKRSSEFPDCLKSGKMLCALANTLRPGIIAQVNERPIPLLERENIQAYLSACDRMGIKKQDLFGASDLYEEKYLPAVLQNIYAVALMASQSRNFDGPVLKVYT